MLRSLRLKNFRAYREAAFDFSRLNLFVGPNNSGKSSAISAINMLAQSMQSYRDLSAPLLLNGPHEQLGTYIDVTHGNIPRTPMGFDISLDDIDLSFDVKYRSQRREMHITRYSLSRDNRKIINYQSNKSESFLYPTLSDLDLPQKLRRSARFRGFWPYDTLQFLAMDVEKLGPDMTERLRSVSRQIRMAEMRFAQSFSNFDSISPFRDQPQRTYIYTGETPHYIGRTGNNGVSLLVNDENRRGSLRSGLIDQINNWLSITGIAKGLFVKNLTPRHFELCLIDHNDKEHNICDVGFGCSQVLPVLVGGLNLIAKMRSREETMYVVQEPEIHLHPNAQASLGSFFVNLAMQNCQLFVETHSDHLIIRIARHIARKDITPEDVRLFFVENVDGGVA